MTSHAAHGKHAEHAQLAPSDRGSVMLDVGGDRGALVLVTDAGMLGVEIEIARADEAVPRTHMAVRERQGPGGSHYAAIYPSLLAGEYVLYGQDGTAQVRVAITGGEVTQLHW